MALTSASTYSDAIAQLDNNLAWEGSVTKAKDALEAIRWLTVHRARFSSRQAGQLNFESLAAMEQRLTDYVGSVDSTARAARAPFVKARPR